MWKIFLESYRLYKLEKQRQKQLKQFLDIGGLDYIAIQNMVNQALAGVEVDIILKDGTKIQIRREDPLNSSAKRILDRELY